MFAKEMLGEKSLAFKIRVEGLTNLEKEVDKIMEKYSRRTVASSEFAKVCLERLQKSIADHIDCTKDINETDDSGRALVHWMVDAVWPEGLRLLFSSDHSVNTNAEDNQGSKYFRFRMFF